MDDELKKYYRGEKLDASFGSEAGKDEARADQEAGLKEEVEKHVGPFLPGKMQPEADKEGAIAPLDWVILNTNEEPLVGNHPLIQAAFKHKIPGRVTAVEEENPDERTKRILISATGVLQSRYRLVHVVFAKEQTKPFIFWENFLNKVVVKAHAPIEVK